MKKFILLFLPLLFGLYSCGSDSEYELFAYANSNGDWGYFDREGKIIITPQFQSAYTFHDGKARVEVEFDNKSKFTFIDKKGNYDILKSWDRATDFSDGLAIVGNDLGYPMAIDTDLEVVLEFPNAGAVSKFSDGSAFKLITRSEDGALIEIIDKNGKVTGTYYPKGGELINHFNDGVFIAEEEDEEEKEFLVTINSKAEVKTEFDDGICSLSSFKDGVALAEFCDGKWGVVDEEGKIVINPQYSEIYRDGDDYLVNIGRKWGWIDSDGQFIINPQFRSARNRGFNGTHLAAVKVGDKWGYVNKKGKLEINPQFESVSPFFGDIALVYKRRSGHGIIDADGKYVANPQFDDVLPEYYTQKIYGVNEQIDDNNFIIESDYVDIDGMIDVIKNNIKPNTFYGLSADQMSLSNLLSIKAKDSLALKKSCDLSEGYMIDIISNYQERYYKYDADGYYDGIQNKGYYKLNPNGKTVTSGLYATGEKSEAVTNLFKVSFYDSNQTDARSCDESLTLSNITFYASVWGSRKVRKGFNQVTNKFYSPTNDDFSKFKNVKISFKAGVYNKLNKRKRNVLKDRLTEAFPGPNDWINNLCFVYDFDVTSQGVVTLKLKASSGCFD